MSEINKARAEYIMNHYSKSKKDILVLAKHLDEHDKDLQQKLLQAEAKLTIAVNALNYYKQFPILGDKAAEALAES